MAEAAGTAVAVAVHAVVAGGTAVVAVMAAGAAGIIPGLRWSLATRIIVRRRSFFSLNTAIITANRAWRRHNRLIREAGPVQVEPGRP